MPDWILTGLVSVVPALLAVGAIYGALSARMTRVEVDVAACVRKEMFDAHAKGVEEKLSDIKAQNGRILDRLYARARDDTNPGA